MLSKERNYEHITSLHSTESIWIRSAVHVSFIDLATSRGTTDSANATSGIGCLNSVTRLDRDIRRKARHGSNLSLLVSGAATHNLSASKQEIGIKEEIKIVAVKI
jgi:hypothetical protein